MLLALLALLVVALVLALPALWRAVGRARAAISERRVAGRPGEALHVPDPGRERRAEQRARELLRSCVNEEEWAMYRDLGFIGVWGRQAARAPRTHRREGGNPSYAYLIYPHKPLVAFVPETRQLLSEYCVEFPELASAVARSRLPDSDDVLAKWMALTGDERRLIADANMHLPGRQVDPGRVRRDLWRLAEWERSRRRDTQVSSGG
ncbi:MAG TPA: hypothetical protein VGR10_07555 [Thermoleophilaceae bacterium]|nr:hypothetical protein [Thermoleophilaceae bacterium]